MITELEELFGRPRLTEWLAGLRREIDGRLGPPVGERERLGKDAHALVSVSGILGFTTLSQACAQLERACLGTGDVSASLERVRVAAADAKQAITIIRAEVG